MPKSMMSKVGLFDFEPSLTIKKTLSFASFAFKLEIESILLINFQYSGKAF